MIDLLVAERWARRVAPVLMAAAALGAANSAAMAQEAFPAHPIRLIVPVPPAGAGDNAARALGRHMSETLGQQIVVENRPGAGTTIGLRAVAKAAPDGYTIGLVAVSNIAIASVTYPDLPDIDKDFAVVAGIANAPHMLVVPATLGVTSVAELVELLRKAPGKHNYASQGNGSLSYLESAVFIKSAGVEVQHIPYTGSSAAMPGLLSGATSMMVDSVSSVLPQAKAGKLRVLATTARHRVPQFPDAPTMAEAGIPNLIADNPFAFLAPAGVPPEALRKLTDAVQKALDDPATLKTLQDAGIVGDFTEPAAFKVVIDDEMKLWPAIARQLSPDSK